MPEEKNSVSETKSDGAQNDVKEPGEKVKPAASPDKTVSAGPRRKVFSIRRLVWLAIILFAAWFTWPLWGGFAPSWLQAVLSPIMEAGRTNPVAKDVVSLKDRVAALEAGVEQLRQGLMTRSHSSSTAEQAQKLKDIETGLNTLRDGLANRTLATTTADQETRLKDLEQKFAEIAAGSGALAKLPDIEIRLNAIDGRLRRIENRPAPTPAPSGPVASAETKPDQGTSYRLQSLEAENEQLSKTVAALQRRVLALETRKPIAAAPESGNGSAGVLMLAVANLKDAAGGEAEFQEEWRTVSVLAADDPDLTAALAALKPHAEKGAPTLDALRLDFPAVADAVARSFGAPKGDSWIDRTIARITALVTIRRTGADASTGDGPAALVARAELALARGDLAAAIRALSGLTGKATEAAKPWLDRAHARAAVNKALGAAQSAALAISGERSGG